MNAWLPDVITGAMALISAAVPVLAVACVLTGRPLPRKENNG